MGLFAYSHMSVVNGVTSQAGGVYQPIIAPDGDTGNATAPAYGHMIVRNWTTGGAMVCLYGGSLIPTLF